MLDFMKVSASVTKLGCFVAPKFLVRPSKDLMIRGGNFYAIWDEANGQWSDNEYRAIELIDAETAAWFQEHKANLDERARPLYLWDADTGLIDKWHKYCQKQQSDNYHPLDETIIFSNTPTNKTDYATKRLPYALEECEIDDYNQLMDVLYSPEERHKIEWAIGAIVSGDSKNIQKFLVFYGAPGTGKSTVLHIIEDLFQGYWTNFDAEALGSKSDAFSLEPFKNNPLIGIQHDGDLSKIEKNDRLNSLVSHETMVVNAKFQSLYSQRFNSFLLMGTNKPVRITDAKSGLVRRLIDVNPTGNLLEKKAYDRMVKNIRFQLGGIAKHCLDVYLEDPARYDDYVSTSMIGASNDFYNFVLDNYDKFARDDEVSLKSAWALYKEYCDDAKVPYPFTMRVFKEELKSYFRTFTERSYDDHGWRIRNIYSGFKAGKFSQEPDARVETSGSDWLKFDYWADCILDEVLADCPAQIATAEGFPPKAWDNCKTFLRDISTALLHYVRPPLNLIVVDFDLTDETGEKSFERNLEAALKWPATYAELSKSGQGIHLHYYYTGDITRLAPLYDEGIEIKTFVGKSALRRKLTRCNRLEIATITANLPLKEVKPAMVSNEVLKNEKGLRALIERNLRKEIHSSTKSSIDFIEHILDEAYANGLTYDIRDMRPRIMAFAAQSSHQADYCIKAVARMKYQSDEQRTMDHDEFSEDTIVFYDVEVFPNLFLVNWKYDGDDECHRMINPSPMEIEAFIQKKLVGFNCRRYDNHILYARMMGYSEYELYLLSQRIINKSPNCMFGEAYNLSFTDVYDFAAKKQTLKKWEIELHIHHQELGLPWDQPVPPEKWEEVALYCDNDVISTEALFHHLKGDFEARQMLAALAGMSVNDTTNSLTTRIIFGKERHPKLVYTDLATGQASDLEYQRTDIETAFPGYEMVIEDIDLPDGRKKTTVKNMYMGEDAGLGGYVYAEPGMYENVITFDVASMHPHSIIAMNVFGEYTRRFRDILNARIAIKHKDFETAAQLMDGKLAPYLKDPSSAKAVAQALKIAINSVYGLTAADFDNLFRDIRNKNNIVALRGALFMITLKHFVQDAGYKVVHIKTDSIKIANPDEYIMDEVLAFGRRYGYEFEVEHKFERICLVNDAVYIAKCGEDDPESPNEWEATGKQFQVPYVYKTLFSHEDLEFYDFCETHSASTALYLDRKEGLADGDHNYEFIGKVGLFCPMLDGYGGGDLVAERKDKNGNIKYDAAAGTKGHKWLEAEEVMNRGIQDGIDYSYFENLAMGAIDTINKFGNFDEFVKENKL